MTAQALLFSLRDEAIRQFTLFWVWCAYPYLDKVEVVPQDIGHVLLNLYKKAFYRVQQKAKLVPAGAAEEAFQPKVTVSQHQREGQLEILVRDNGIGISEKIKPKIFQPFFTTKPPGEGTGLGLSLSYDIVTKGHGGELRVDSVEGEFTEFAILVPVAVSSPAGSTPLSKEAPLPTYPTGG